MANTHMRTVKRYGRTILSNSIYCVSKFAFHFAPAWATRWTREKGFAVSPYQMNGRQKTLRQQARSFTIEFRGNKINVLEWGAGQTILLVHGWAGRAMQMDSLISALLDKGFKVVAFDHKGHGESSARFSSFLEMVRGTKLVVDHYAGELHGVIAHSIGSNAVFKVSEHFERKLNIAVIAPMENFPNWLEKMRQRIGIDEKLFASVIGQIESETELKLLEQCHLDFEKIKRHEILLVHDKLDRINKISASYAIQRALPKAILMETEMLGHSRILGNQAVLERVVAHIAG